MADPENSLRGGGGGGAMICSQGPLKCSNGTWGMFDIYIANIEGEPLIRH